MGREAYPWCGPEDCDRYVRHPFSRRAVGDRAADEPALHHWRVNVFGLFFFDQWDPCGSAKPRGPGVALPHIKVFFFPAEMAPIQTELRGLLERAVRKSKRTRLHRRFANNLLGIWPALWTFLTLEAVEPTNNAAERSLRGPVIHRKLSHGNQSEDGERFIERALSASVTCRLQGRSLFAYAAELLQAHARGDPLPTLA